jgi:hypothetical protein
MAQQDPQEKDMIIQNISQADMESVKALMMNN